MNRTTKIVLIVSAVAAAGVGGYFLYKKLKNKPGENMSSTNGINKKVVANPDGSDRATRNNNPMNIRNSKDIFDGEIGTDGAFKVFQSGAYGTRAAFKILKTYQTAHGLKTLKQKLNRWAPANENAADYAESVAQMAGVDVNGVADYANLNYWLQVMPAWAKREGHYDLKEAEIKEAYKLAGFGS